MGAGGGGSPVRISVRTTYQRINTPSGCCTFTMGNHGRSGIGLFAFWALAILVAALGPESLPEAPVFDVVRAEAIAAPEVARAERFVVSR